MKKNLALALALVTLCLGLASCGNGSDKPKYKTLSLTEANLTYVDDVWEGNTDTTVTKLTIQIFDFEHMTGYSEWQGTGSYYWGGFTAAKIANDEPGYEGCVAKGGVDGVGTPYLVTSAVECTMTFNDGMMHSPKSMYVCNNTQTYLGITEGDTYARKFAAGDSFTLTITGLDEKGNEGADIVVYLADYRSQDEANWTVITDWTSVDLNSLGAVSGLKFTVNSTDVGDWGFNTNASFCMDKLVVD